MFDHLLSGLVSGAGSWVGMALLGLVAQHGPGVTRRAWRTVRRLLRRGNLRSLAGNAGVMG